MAAALMLGATVIDLSVNSLPMGYWFHVVDKESQEFGNTSPYLFH